jgi:hypothetical protein
MKPRKPPAKIVDNVVENIYALDKILEGFALPE